MILAIIFLVIFAGFTGFGIYRSIALIKTPMIEVDYKKFIFVQLALIGASVVAFLVASFGFHQWMGVNPDALHIVELVFGTLLFIGCLLVAINAFIVHYYGRNIPERLDKWLFVALTVGFTVSAFALFLYTNGLAIPKEMYPLANGISFTKGLVTPENGTPNIAFYALCILSGAILIYFLCDHYMYQEYGEHGTLESTFFVAFPAGILGARIWYVVGNWAKEFDYGRAMVDMNGFKVWAPLAIWNGGLTILGGAIMGIVVGVAWYLWKNKGKSIWIAVDIIVPTILIAQAVGRWGNFFNCEVHGLAVDDSNWKWLPEIIFNNAKYSSTGLDLRGTNQLYVPLFFIECITNLLGYFVLAHVFGKALRKYTELGDLCFGYVIWYGLTRVLMEPLRSSEYQMGENGYWSWVWSMIFVLAGTLLIVINHIVRHIIRKRKNTYTVKSNDGFKGAASTAAVLLVSTALIVSGALLMNSNEFAPVVKYNGFNIGLMLLILGLSAFLALAISLITLIEYFKNGPQNETI